MKSHYLLLLLGLVLFSKLPPVTGINRVSSNAHATAANAEEVKGKMARPRADVGQLGRMHGGIVAPDNNLAIKTKGAEAEKEASSAKIQVRGGIRALQDITPPVVDVRLPVEGELVTDVSYLVAARVSDSSSDVSSVQFQFKVPPHDVKTDWLDASAPIPDNPDVYYLPLPLQLGPDGLWQWRARAYDAVGNKEVTSWIDFDIRTERLPDNLDLTVTVDGGEEIELRLTRRSVRTDDYQLKLWDGSRGYVPKPPKEVRTYRGTVVGHPNTIVIGSLFPDGTANLNGFEGKSYKWRLEHIDMRSQLPPLSVFEEMLDEYTSDAEGYGDDLDGDIVENYRRSLSERGGNGRALSSSSATGSIQPPSPYFPPGGGMKELELAFDVTDYWLHDEWVGSMDRAVAEVEYLANVYDHFMARDTMVASVVTQTVIRTEQFYFPEGMCGSQLKLITDEWRDGALSDTRWDLVNSMFAAETQRVGAAGCAKGNNVGKDEAAVSIKALYHETGHNWGVQHKTYARDTMDGNRPHHGPCNVERLLRKREEEIGQGNLVDVAAPYPDPLHPYAHVDIGTTLVGEPLDIPVLANDWDGNGDDISIRTYTPATANGGTVTKLIGVNDVKVLRYTPSPGYVGKDIIYYEVEDSTGLYTQELVHVEVINGGLALEYSFELNSITFPGNVLDATGLPHPGRYHGESVGGVIGRGVRLADSLIVDHRNLLPPGVTASDREDDYPLDYFQALGNSFDPMDRSYSLSFWFRPDEINGLVQVARKDYQRDGQKYGYHIDISGGRVHFSMKEFSGLAEDFQASSDPVLERGVWYHCALVLDRSAGIDRAVLYLDGAKLFQSDLLPGSFVFMGRGPLRFGEGAEGDLSVDEVRVHTRALSTTEIWDLVGDGGKPSRFGDFLEAEDAADHGGGSFYSECGGDYTGTGYFDYEEEGEAAFLEWEVDVPRGGDYELTFRYSQKSENRRLKIEVNGVIVDEAKGFPVTNAWCKWDTTDITVSLVAGTNTVKAAAKGNYGPNIDHLAVRDVPATYDIPPRFAMDVIDGQRACPGKEIVGSVADFALDWNSVDTLAFEKLSGPGWMSIGLDGTLSGDPKNRHVGTNEFKVRVTDGSGLKDEAFLEVDVQPMPEGIVDFTDKIRSFGGDEDKAGTATIEECGATLALRGNLYKSIALDPPYDVAQSTVIEFDFRSGDRGDVHAIGLDEDDGANKGYYFKLYGTRTKSSYITDFATYNDDAPYAKHYVIPVGQFYTGPKTRLFFVNDHDSSNDPTAESIYTNVKIYESESPPTPPPTSGTTLPPTNDPTKDPTPSPTHPSTNEPTKDPTPSPTHSPTKEPTKEPTLGPTTPPTNAPTTSSGNNAVDLTGFATYVSTEQFFAPDSSAYFLVTDPNLGPTERVWWGESRTTVNLTLASPCLPPGETVIASVMAQQTACDKTWQMNAGRGRNECGHSLVLTLDGAGANPWLEYYYLLGCAFHSMGGAYEFIAYMWHDNDPNVETVIGSLHLDFVLTVETDLPALADVGDCTKSDPCGECEGDCDNDNHCGWGLICHKRDGVAEVPGCAGAGTQNTDHCVAPPPGTLVRVGNDGEPAAAFPLGRCEGDCDNDGDCAAGLLCFERDGTEPVPGCGGTGAPKGDYCYDLNDAL